jgi:hypothetical protein
MYILQLLRGLCGASFGMSIGGVSIVYAEGAACRNTDLNDSGEGSSWRSLFPLSVPVTRQALWFPRNVGISFTAVA